MKILCLGISHRTAALALRERFSISQQQLGATAVDLCGTGTLSEAVVLSTCNRVELYAATPHPDDGFDALASFARRHAGIEPAGNCYQLHCPESILHLFRVVCGLDSMVIGETEVFGQVKRAYEAACIAGATSRNLNKLFQRAFNVAKEVRSSTSIARGSISVGSVAVDLAQKIFGNLEHCKIMVLGAGETSEHTARALFSRGARTIFVSNRSFARADSLAREMDGKAVRFDNWEKNCTDLDILISSTAAPHSILTRERIAALMRRRPARPLFVIDLAVPRDVEPSVNEIDGVYLYDIDSLQAIARQSLEVRRGELVECERMISRHVDDFVRWMTKGASHAHRELLLPSLPHELRAS